MAKTKEQKETKEMAAPEAQNAQSANEIKPAEIISVRTTKQPQTILDLDTMEEVKITVVYNNYDVNEMAVARDSAGAILADPKMFTGKINWSAATLEEQLKAAEALVQPVEEQIKAMLTYAGSQSYQAGKKAAYASVKNPFTPELKRKTVELLGGTAAFAETSNKDIGERLMVALAAKNPEALKWVERARVVLEAVAPSF